MDLLKVVGAALEATRPQLDARGHELRLELPNRPILVLGDTTRLTQVFVNLLHNAAKYTPEGGVITVMGMAKDGFATITVMDTGIGIQTEMLPRIFDLFTQGERGLDRADGGLGIGLTLARRLVALHGGRITAASPGPGRGSEFSVQLPLLGSVDARIGPEVTLPAPRSEGRRRVLVVDDNQDSAESTAEAAAAVGHDVHVAFDGTTALAEASAFAPELVMPDLGLPRMDGYEVARRLRATPVLADAVLVAVTGYGQGRRPQALERGRIQRPPGQAGRSLQLKRVLARLESRG